MTSDSAACCASGDGPAQSSSASHSTCRPTRKALIQSSRANPRGPCAWLPRAEDQVLGGDVAVAGQRRELHPVVREHLVTYVVEKPLVWRAYDGISVRITATAVCVTSSSGPGRRAGCGAAPG
ncbi:hypothetical protein [Streptomyces sp. F001]|uniref:hypothetical protein n=1 Tax=Streptomyces sp. F001 TaxID=1510026 RepID=UPI00101E5654|nr:hypothetical protein [Streptomyces sp. F001]